MHLAYKAQHEFAFKQDALHHDARRRLSNSSKALGFFVFGIVTTFV